VSRSLTQQDDVERLLRSDSYFADVAIYSEAKGTAATEVDNALGGRRVRGGKKGGLVLIVTQPGETPDPMRATPLLHRRRHIVRIIEVPEVNRAAGGTGITADDAKDRVMQRLHERYLGRASLVWVGNEPWVDTQGGYGWEAAFDIQDDLDTEIRAAQPIVEFAGGNCTLTGTGRPGEILYYTTDGSAPTPGGANVNVYAAPFAVASGATVRASTIATGYVLGNFTEAVAP
jgi:hypothetical protein